MNCEMTFLYFQNESCSEIIFMLSANDGTYFYYFFGSQKFDNNPGFHWKCYWKESAHEI